jgi:hypothetical protein
MAAKKKTATKRSSSRSGGKATKSPAKYKALKRKGMPKARAAKIANAGTGASRKGGKKGGAASKTRSKRSSSK